MNDERLSEMADQRTGYKEICRQKHISCLVQREERKSLMKLIGRTIATKKVISGAFCFLKGYKEGRFKLSPTEKDVEATRRENNLQKKIS